MHHGAVRPCKCTVLHLIAFNLNETSASFNNNFDLVITIIQTFKNSSLKGSFTTSSIWLSLRQSALKSAIYSHIVWVRLIDSNLFREMVISLSIFLCSIHSIEDYCRLKFISPGTFLAAAFKAGFVDSLYCNIFHGSKLQGLIQDSSSSNSAWNIVRQPYYIAGASPQNLRIVVSHMWSIEEPLDNANMGTTSRRT